MTLYLCKGKDCNYLITDNRLKEIINNDGYVNIIGTYILDNNKVLDQVKSDLPNIEIIQSLEVEK